MSVGIDTDEFQKRVRDREVNSDQTIHLYDNWVRRFESWRPGEEPDEAMLRDFDSFLQDSERPGYPWESRRGRPAPDEYAFQTRVVALSGVKLWLKHQYDISIETEVQNIAAGEPEPFDPTVLDPGEVNRVIQQADVACDNPDCRAAISVGYDAILRGAELVDARLEDFDSGEGSLYVRAKKGSEPATIQLGSRAATDLRNHASTYPDRDLLFTNAYDNKLKPQVWNNHFREKHHTAGFHSFARHSPINNRLTQGESFEDVFLRARHTNARTTLKYVSYIGMDVDSKIIDGR